MKFFFVHYKFIYNISEKFKKLAIRNIFTTLSFLFCFSGSNRSVQIGPSFAAKPVLYLCTRIHMYNIYIYVHLYVALAPTEEDMWSNSTASQIGRENVLKSSSVAVTLDFPNN